MTKQLKTADWTLVCQYQEGNDDALAQLFQVHFKYLYLIAYKVLSHPQDAEDCIQDVLLYLLKIDVADRTTKVKPNPSNVLPSFIMRVKNKAIDIWRKNKRKPSSSIEYQCDDFQLMEIEAEKDQDVLSTIYQRELKNICERSISKEDEKAYFALFIDGHNRASITTQLGLDAIQVKVLRQRVMRKIKRKLITYLNY